MIALEVLTTAFIAFCLLFAGFAGWKIGRCFPRKPGKPGKP